MNKRLKTAGLAVALAVLGLSTTNCIRISVTTTDSSSCISDTDSSSADIFDMLIAYSSDSTTTTTTETTTYSTSNVNLRHNHSDVAIITENSVSTLNVTGFSAQGTIAFNTSLSGGKVVTKHTFTFDPAPKEEEFLRLDSICALPIPESIDENTALFYEDKDHKVHNSWTKTDNVYTYHTTDKMLESGDVECTVVIDRDANQAEMVIEIKL